MRRAMGLGGSDAGFTTRKVTTFVIAHDELEMMVITTGEKEFCRTATISAV